MTDEPQPDMIGPSPSERGLPAVPADPAEHAVDFSRRYAEDLEIVAGQAMIDLNLTSDQMGAEDHQRGSEHHAFFPKEREGGTVSPDGRVMLDSGIMNPHLLDSGYDEDTQKLWRKTKLRPRAEAIIAHELAEFDHEGDHELALIAAPETGLPISRAAREMLKQMEKGWRGR
jgi:hypothetical protein